MSEKNKAIVRRQEEELFTRGNLDAATELYTPDYVGHDPLKPSGERDKVSCQSTHRMGMCRTLLRWT